MLHAGRTVLVPMQSRNIPHERAYAAAYLLDSKAPSALTPSNGDAVKLRCFSSVCPLPHFHSLLCSSSILPLFSNI
jgi:hypothetical protein